MSRQEQTGPGLNLGTRILTLAFGLTTLWLTGVDGFGIQRVLKVRGVVVLDHLDTGRAVVGYLIDVCAFHEVHADIRVTLL